MVEGGQELVEPGLPGGEGGNGGEDAEVADAQSCVAPAARIISPGSPGDLRPVSGTHRPADLPEVNLCLDRHPHIACLLAAVVLPAALSEDRTAAFHDDGSPALVVDRLRGPPSLQRLLTANRH